MMFALLNGMLNYKSRSQNKSNVLQALTLILALAVSVAADASRGASAEPERKAKISDYQRIARIDHARELLGKHYEKSSVQSGESIKKVNGFVYRTVRSRLPKKFQKDYQRVAQTIIDEGLKYEFDPIFLMSVIQGESSWKVSTIGGVGEVGLMQIRPSTAAWISQKLGLPFKGSKKELLDPVTNIKIGAAYLSWLRGHFDMHARLYLAAYNMGQRNVATALKQNVWPRDYPLHVMRHYTDFYSSLQEGS